MNYVDIDRPMTQQEIWEQALLLYDAMNLLCHGEELNVIVCACAIMLKAVSMNHSHSSTEQEPDRYDITEANVINLLLDVMKKAEPTTNKGGQLQ